MKGSICSILIAMVWFVAAGQETDKPALLSNATVFAKYTPLFGILGTEYPASTLAPPNFTEIGYNKRLGEVVSVTLNVLAGRMTSGDDISIVKHEMSYFGAKLGIGLKGSQHNYWNRSFVHFEYCIVPTFQSISLTFRDMYDWSNYSENMKEWKTYHYYQLGYTFLINLNTAKNIHALMDIALQVVPDNRTPFKALPVLEKYDIIVPGAGSFILNPSLSFGFGYSF